MSLDKVASSTTGWWNLCTNEQACQTSTLRSVAVESIT